MIILLLLCVYAPSSGFTKDVQSRTLLVNVPGDPRSLSSCGRPSFKGDGYCDDENNNAGCNYDNGDCCNNDNPNWDDYCWYCECIEPSSCLHEDDGYCDDENNNAGCNYDGGDCCGNSGLNWDFYCQYCQCLDPDYNSGGSWCHCGVPNSFTRISNGHTTYPHQYPWHVGIVNYNNDNPFCGGSLLSDRYVLTAAHCVGAQSEDSIKVLLGEHNVQQGYDGAFKAGVAQITIHPNYNSNTMDHDFALVRLAQPVQFSSSVRPVCLPQNNYADYIGYSAIITGWGQLYDGGPWANTLHAAEVTVFANNNCGSISQWDLTENMMCAGNFYGNKDPCLGDSGGPLVTYDNGAMIQIGVASWGYGCGQSGYPGIYGSVNKILGWIAYHMDDSTTCPRP